MCRPFVAAVLCFAPLFLCLGPTRAQDAPGAKSDVVFTVNGQAVTYKELLRALERQTVTPPGGGQPTNALRVALDQLVGQKVIMAEAGAQNLVPSNAAIEAYYRTQKKLFEAQFLGKIYEQAMADQGTMPDDVKREFRYQLAESALYARRLKLSEEELKKTYDDLKKSNGIGFPARYQLRVILASTVAESQKAKTLLNQGKAFAEVARQVNPAQLKATGGLMPQAVSATQIPATWREKAAATNVGAFFGPVDAGGTTPGEAVTKAWVLVEQKLPKLEISYEEARPLVQRSLVMQRMTQPENAGIVNEIKNKKRAVKFDTVDKLYERVWNNLKDAATAGSALPDAAPAVPDVR